MKYSSAILTIFLGIFIASGFEPGKAAKKSPSRIETPIVFAENRGQFDARAKFVVQGRSTTAYFTSQGMAMSLTQASDRRKRWNLKLDFVGGAAAALKGRETAPAYVSYFSGVQKNWKAGVPTYSSIVYSDLWPGIDLVYSGTVNRLKYEFIVHPGADPIQIRLAYRGTNAPLVVNRKGQLEISTPLGVINDDKPISYQGKNKEIKSEFVVYPRAIDGSQEYGFKLGKYDRKKTLVIDPAILVYSGFIGGGGDDEGHSIAVDSAGNAYVTGVTTSAQATFPETAGPDLTYNGRTDAFVAKIKADGSGLVYAGYIGGDGDDAGHAIAVNQAGDAYVTGWTTSTQSTFPVILGPDLTFNGAIDAFVAKVSRDGTTLEYCGYLGGDDEDEGLGIAVNASGNAYLTGLTASNETTFPKLVGPGLIFKGAIDAFVARIKADGSGLDYAGYLGGGGDDQGRGIAVDTAGNSYVTGLTTSSEATFTMVGTLDPSFNGGTDAFVTKINATGSSVTYSGYLGGSGIDEAYGIAVDSSNSAYVTGRTNSTEATFPESIGPDLSFNGMVDAFVAKVNSTGSALSYAGYIGGGDDDEGYSVAVDSAGNAYVTGRTASGEATFPKSNAFDLTLNGVADAFIAKVGSTGSALTYAGYLGGNGLEEGYGTAVRGLRQVFVTGRSTSADGSFPTMIGPSSNFGGASDAFVMRIDDNSVTCSPSTISPETLPNGILGASYSQTLSASGGPGPFGFGIISGGLPAGLSLSLAGDISGASTQAGSFNFTVIATDAAGCSSTKTYTLVVITCPVINISPESLPGGTVGVGYSQNLTGSGGSSSYSFSVITGNLPPGLDLSSSGSIIGMPTMAGSFGFTVRALDANLCPGTRAYNIVISPSANLGLQYFPLPRPIRLLDTRENATACTMPNAPLQAGIPRTQAARVTCDNITIPANAAAVVGNATVVNFLSGAGFITLYPTGAAQPTVSNLNYLQNQIIPNAFTVGLSAGGEFNLFASSTTHIIVDITGYYAPPASGGLYYHPLPAPIRLLDTRENATACTTPGAPLQAGILFRQNARLTCNNITIPANAQAVVGNGTVVNFLSGAGFITLWPHGAQQPTVSNLNYLQNQIIPNAFTVGLGVSGEFDIFASSSTHFIADITGYYSPDSAPDVNGVMGLLYNPLPSPIRLLDTRENAVACTTPEAPLQGGASLNQLARLTCNNITIPANARAVVGNGTVVNFISGAGFITLFPAGSQQPAVSNLNYLQNQVIPNAFTVGLSSGGEFSIFASSTTHFIADVTGYFAP